MSLHLNQAAMKPSAHTTELYLGPLERSGRIRGVALVLGVLTFGWLPLKLTESLEMPATLSWAAIGLTALLIPPLSLLALFLLIRHLLKTRTLNRSEYWSYQYSDRFSVRVLRRWRIR